MSLRPRILQIDTPASELAPVVSFWAAALSATPAQAPGAFTHLVGATSALEVHVQAVSDDPPRYHLDLEPTDPASRRAEVARLVGLGAQEVADFDEGYTVVADSAGLLFCVIDRGAAQPTPVRTRQGGRGYLDAAFIDVPGAQVDGEVAFWSAALGATPSRSGDPASPYTQLAGACGPAGPLTLHVQAVQAPPRWHVDVSAADVEAEAARLIALGARHVADVEDWMTLADPVGNLLCVVPA